jgi:hypothetical protein
VTNGGSPLEASNVAASIAPIIDRLRLAIASRMRSAGVEIGGAYGFGPEGGRTLAMLRNTVPDRAVAVDAVRAMFVYLPADAVQAGLDELTTSGLVDIDGATLRLSAPGREAMDRFWAMAVQVADDLWSSAPSITQLSSLVEAAVDRARQSAGTTFGVIAPPADGSGPAATTAASTLAELLTALRFHRFDCHVAAWRGEGLTATEVSTLADQDLVARIEAETNRLAADPYAVLAPDERFVLVAGLGALQG